MIKALQQVDLEKAKELEQWRDQAQQALKRIERLNWYATPVEEEE
jgi:hypothetical protein